MNYFGIQTELSVVKRSFCLTQFHPYSKITQQIFFTINVAGLEWQTS